MLTEQQRSLGRIKVLLILSRKIDEPPSAFDSLSNLERKTAKNCLSYKNSKTTEVDKHNLLNI